VLTADFREDIVGIEYSSSEPVTFFSAPDRPAESSGSSTARI
jgi:hypothetical protein